MCLKGEWLPLNVNHKRITIIDILITQYDHCKKEVLGTHFELIGTNCFSKSGKILKLCCII